MIDSTTLQWPTHPSGSLSLGMVEALGGQVARSRIHQVGDAGSFAYVGTSNPQMTTAYERSRRLCQM